MDRSTATKLAYGFLTAACVAAFALPGLRMLAEEERVRDDVPFSTFPMFSRPLPRLHGMTHVRGLTKDGETRIIHYRYWTTGGMNQARRNLRHVRGKKNRDRARQLCQKAARAVAKRKRFRDITRVEVLTHAYELETYFGDRKFEPERSRLHAACRVERQDEA